MHVGLLVHCNPCLACCVCLACEIVLFVFVCWSCLSGRVVCPECYLVVPVYLCWYPDCGILDMECLVGGSCLILVNRLSLGNLGVITVSLRGGVRGCASSLLLVVSPGFPAISLSLLLCPFADLRVRLSALSLLVRPLSVFFSVRPTLFQSFSVGAGLNR